MSGAEGLELSLREAGATYEQIAELVGCTPLQACVRVKAQIDAAVPHEHPTLLEVPGLGRAKTCAVGGKTEHWPVPMRFVWHHLLPQAAGGKTEVDNLVSLCDACHYAVHALLYWLATHEGQPLRFGAAAVPDRRRLAHLGYQRAVALGTVAKIPNEGSVIE